MLLSELFPESSEVYKERWLSRRDAVHVKDIASFDLRELEYEFNDLVFGYHMLQTRMSSMVEELRTRARRRRRG